jgi:hypothetical protein
VTGARIPLGLKLGYTAWMAVWVPLYWSENGWTNFLWLCDFANFVVLVAIWRESSLLVSSQISAVLLIQVVWAVDFFGRLTAGVHPVGGTEYMFDEAAPLWLRGLSLFHLWSVPLLVWLGRRLGHDRRGWWLATACAAALFPLGQQLGTREQNLNWMWAPFGVEQVWLPPLVFALVAVPIAAAALFWPGDLLARRLLRGLSPVRDGTGPRRPPAAGDG